MKEGEDEREEDNYEKEFCNLKIESELAKKNLAILRNQVIYVLPDEENKNIFENSN